MDESMTARLILLGLDGAGFDFVSALMDAGVLPNLQKMARVGCFRPLRSTTPPITGPSWLGLVSGRDVDQTGIADFLIPRSPLFDLRPLSSADFRGHTIWDHVSDAGGRVAVFNFPVLYPPYAINGLMVSGFGTDESTQWTSPPSLKADLLAEVGAGYNLTVNYHHEIYDDADRFLADLEASLDRRLRAAEYCCRRERWDLFVAVFSETDWLLHRCWSDLDPSHPLYDKARSPAIADRARKLWQKIDAWIPDLLDAMGEGCNLLVCSDHGFGPNTSTIQINAVLERAGLLVRRPSSSKSTARIRHLGAKAAQRVGAAAARIGGPAGRIIGRARRKARRYLPKDDSAYLSAVIDHEKSVAFDPGHTIPFGGLYVSPRIDRGSADYDAALERVSEALTDFASQVAIPIDLQRQAKDSPHALTLPDLIVSADGWGTTFSKTGFSGDPFRPSCFSPRHTGSHRMRGILLGSGPAFRADDGHDEVSILDVAPSVLALFGITPPPDRRGRTLDEMVRVADLHHTARDAGSRPADGSGSDDDERDVRERLRGLGYID